MLSQITRAAGADTSAPSPDLGTITTTTYLGWFAGANEANTDVAWPPNTSAVPVLAAIGTLFSGNPANAPAAVPPVTTPSSALVM
jgi:hypothetical protein